LQCSNLSGLEIPSCTDRLITSLFADDTTVYLSADSDDFATLTSILEDWCTAARAKFNVNKTEVILIRSRAFQDRFVADRTLRAGDSRIPDNVHISQEGEAVQILSAWYGNHINVEAPWTPVVEAINKDLERWHRGHPTLEGRKLIVQMVIGGRTQYLMKVQGMPKHIEAHLEKCACQFVWQDKPFSPTNSETL
ncbi:hypothetical protein NEOLEDRAFT_1035843, partial [Neolentinus lepideus HHB14362 ss-1]